MKKKTKKPTKKTIKQPVNVFFNIRQVDPKKFIHENSVHVVRLVENCNPRLLTFNTTEELNDWLFNFDFEHQDQDPGKTGTWIDHIFLDVSGGVFDIDQLEVQDEADL